MQKEPFANELFIDELQHIKCSGMSALCFTNTSRNHHKIQFREKISLDSSYILHCQTVQLCIIIYHPNPHSPGNHYACWVKTRTWSLIPWYSTKIKPIRKYSLVSCFLHVSYNPQHLEYFLFFRSFLRLCITFKNAHRMHTDILQILLSNIKTQNQQFSAYSKNTTENNVANTSTSIDVDFISSQNICLHLWKDQN